MSEHFGQRSIYETAQDAQDKIRTALYSLSEMAFSNTNGAHIYHHTAANDQTQWHGYQAKFIPQQPRSIFPQLDISYEEQSHYLVDAPERSLVLSEYYDLLFDSGLGENMREVQFGSRTIYRYLLADSGVHRGISYQQFAALGDEKYYLPGGLIYGFRTIPSDIADREVLVDLQLDLATLDERDSERVAAAVEWLQQS